MDRVQLDLDAILDRRISSLEASYIVSNSQTCQRFLRANGVIADASLCQVCNVSILQSSYFKNRLIVCSCVKILPELVPFLYYIILYNDCAVATQNNHEFNWGNSGMFL